MDEEYKNIIMNSSKTTISILLHLMMGQLSFLFSSSTSIVVIISAGTLWQVPWWSVIKICKSVEAASTPMTAVLVCLSSHDV